MSKLLVIDIQSAYIRAVAGESVRKIAKSLYVTEGALRHHFRKCTPPREIRRLAFALYHAQQQRAMLGEDERHAVDAMVVREKAKIKAVAGKA